MVHNVPQAFEQEMLTVPLALLFPPRGGRRGDNIHGGHAVHHAHASGVDMAEVADVPDPVDLLVQLAEYPRASLRGALDVHGFVEGGILRAGEVEDDVAVVVGVSGPPAENEDCEVDGDGSVGAADAG